MDNFYTEEELVLTKLTRNTRENIIKSMTEEGVPYKSGEIRVLNEIMSGLDDQINKLATLRLKNEEASQNGAMLETIAGALKAVKVNQNDKSTEFNIEIEDKFIPANIVPGETEMNPEKLVAADFLDIEIDKE